MKAIGHYVVIAVREAARQQDSRPARDNDADREPRPGIGARIRKLFGGKRVVREPGFAASSSWLSEFVPQLTAHPQRSTYR